MLKLKSKIQRFLNDNRGLETLEVAAIAIGTVALIAVVVEIYNISQKKLEDAGKQLAGN